MGIGRFDPRAQDGMNVEGLQAMTQDPLERVTELRERREKLFTSQQRAYAVMNLAENLASDDEHLGSVCQQVNEIIGRDIEAVDRQLASAAIELEHKVRADKEDA